MHELATAPRPDRTSVRTPVGAARILGLGTALPGGHVSSAEIEARLGLREGWIFERTGIRSRPHAGEAETLTGLAAAAAADAVGAAGIDPAELDLVLVATLTQDALLPNTAPLVAGAIGADRAGACDLGAACTGFLSALSLATAQIESGRAGYVLVVGADLVSRFTDHSDRKTAGLFADGAGAVVLGADGPGWVGEIIMRSDAGEAECIVAARDEGLIRMRGQDTFRAAVAALSEVTLEVLAAEQLELADIDAFVYHQANSRIIAAVGEKLGLDRAKVVDCIRELGNSSAATLPLALSEADRSGLLRPGSMVLLASFGAGLTWAGGLIEWGGEVAR